MLIIQGLNCIHLSQCFIKLEVINNYRAIYLMLSDRRPLTFYFETGPDQ